MKQAMTLLLLLTVAQAWAMEPPVMEWDRHYFPGYSPFFRDVLVLSEDGYLISGRVGSPIQAYLIRVDQGGNILWTYGNGDWSYQEAYSSTELADGSIVTTGAYRLSPSSSLGLFLSRVSSDGDEVWTKVYDFSGTTERGYSVTSLPDDGFCITGVNYSGGEAQAWILKTDSAGDTLWTDTWGGSYSDYSKRALSLGGQLVVLASVCSSELPSHGPHLLFYSLDGEYLWGTDYPGLEGGGADMCLAPDGGITFITGGGTIAHTDSIGNLLWTDAGSTTERGITTTWSSISPCMDGGYVISGIYEYILVPDSDPAPRRGPVHTDDDEIWGILVRFDAGGSELWSMYVDPGGSDQVKLYDALQLPEGGYIATGYLYDFSGGTGVNGYLVCYAPETGIGEGIQSPPCLSLDVPLPNPSSGSFSIGYGVPSPMRVDLTVYDLSGRRIESLVIDEVVEGDRSILWDPGDAPSGCYLVVLRTEEGTLTRTCLRL